MVVWINEIFFFIYIFFFIKINSNIYATTILDHETDLYVQDILNIISIKNNYNKKIFYNIILDDKPNAYINHNNILHISTGLFKKTISYEAIVGVLAHEVGHLQKNHILKRKEKLKKVVGFNNLTNLSIIAGSLITKNGNDQIAQALITNQAGLQNFYYSFNRDQEREADNYAIETLNKLNLSPIPLINFLNLLEKESIKQGISKDHFKFASHPIYQERYEIIINKKTNKKYNFDEEKNKKFNFIKAKFYGFTESNNFFFNQNLSGDYKRYANSINLSKQGKLKESLNILNDLIKKNKGNIFLLETKADILYSNGFLAEALLFYEKTLLSLPKNNYVNKRIFDINFSNRKNINNNISLINRFYFLLDVFSRDEELKKKFMILAIDSKSKNWFNFLSIREDFKNKLIDKKEYEKNLIKIKSVSNNNNLIKYINKSLGRINE